MATGTTIGCIDATRTCTHLNFCEKPKDAFCGTSDSSAYSTDIGMVLLNDYKLVLGGCTGALFVQETSTRLCASRRHTRKLDEFHELHILGLLMEIQGCRNKITEATMVIVSGSMICRVLQRHGYIAGGKAAVYGIQRAFHGGSVTVSPLVCLDRRNRLR